MELKLDKLIDKIKKDGVEGAQKASDEILKKAEQKATAVAESANKKARQIITEAEANAEKIRSNAEAALKQSARDTVLVCKEQLIALFDRVFKQEIAGTLTADFLKDLLLHMVENWHGEDRFNVLLNDKDKKELEKLLFSQAQKSLQEQITFKVDGGISNGFRIGLKGGDVYYDMTDESIADFLKELLSPSIRSILDQENG